MKRSVFFFVLVFILVVVYSASAETTVRHYIPEAEATVEIPIGIVCVSRDADETNTFFQIGSMDYSTVHQYMLDNNMFLYGMTTDFSGEFALGMIEYSGEDFGDMDEFSLSIIRNQLKQTYESQGAKNVTVNMYEGSEKKAVRIHYSVPSSEMNQFVVFYYISNGTKMILIRFVSFFNDISDSQEKMIQSIIDTAVWGKQQYSAEPKGQTDQGIYTDYETGLTFSVPSDWSEVKFVAVEEGKKVKYRIGTSNVWVLYEGDDLWDDVVENYGELIDSLHVTREDFGNNMLSTEFIANMLGCNEKNISMKTIAGQEYYCLDNSIAVDSGLFSMEAQNIIYICVRDAYMYWFQLSGIGISEYANDFNLFMESITYP